MASMQMDVKKRRGEHYHGYLLRVRSEILRYHKAKDEQRPARRFYSPEFERWRLQRLSGECTSDEDEEAVVQQPDFTKEESQEEEGPVEWPREVREVDWPRTPRENQLPIRQNLVSDVAVDTTDGPRRGSLPTSESQAVRGAMPSDVQLSSLCLTPEDFLRLPSARREAVLSAVSAISAQENSPAKGSTTPVLSRPASAPGPGSLQGSKSAVQSSKFRLLTPVELSVKASRQQTLGLERAYSSASSTRLAKAVSMANQGELVGKGWKANLAKLQAAEDKLVSQDGDASRVSMAINRLRSRGLRGRGAQATEGAGDGSHRNAVDQWLQQLAEDYPDEFCQKQMQGIPSTSLAPPCKAIQEAVAARDDPGNARICSKLWVLCLHGEPLREADWQLRVVWLSSSGRLWFGQEGSEDAVPCSLQLGGEIVPDLQVVRARRYVDYPETIRDQSVTAMRIEGTSGRYPRRKILASENAQVVEEWMEACLLPVQRKKEVVEQTAAFSTPRESSAPSANPSGDVPYSTAQDSPATSWPESVASPGAWSGGLRTPSTSQARKSPDVIRRASCLSGHTNSAKKKLFHSASRRSLC
eukprot:TRINITY_DN61051_c0_g1_i1.p1 TRINITY_DN61051_c0_g1~~TRINITY_DN61051_c0_g1_i1.p1  ORF type:complete len:603 (-),score=114.23 TRINITY_DN61051_c0_g1_i1:11-1765(-)